MMKMLDCDVFRSLSLLLLLTTTVWCIDFTATNKDQELESSLQIIFICHPFTKFNVLPFTLGGIEGQLYPKSRVNIFFKTEVYKSVFDGNFNTSVNKYKYNKITIDVLKKWIADNRKDYNDIELQMDEISDEEESEDNDNEYWSTRRFKKIMTLKNRGLLYARRKWADFALFIDADVVLTNPNTFQTLINKNNTVGAPMLYSLGTYSNFWAGITERGYYKRTDEYIPILERQVEGEFPVPMIHSCVFINLRKKSTSGLTYNASELSDIPFDDIIAFATSAKLNSIPLLVNNVEVWGFILPPIETLDIEELNRALVDLQLEAISEGTSFPVGKRLLHFVDRPTKEKLEVDNIYVINLLRRPDRLNVMLKCFNTMGIDVEVWTATDGKEITKNYLDEIGVKVIPGYLDPYHKRPMTYGEIGCFLSHYFIWEDIVKKNFSKAIIFEDDVRFEQKFKQRMTKAVLSLASHQDVDFLYIGRKRQGEAKEEYIVAKGLVKPTYSYWTIGYLITQRGAQKLLDAKPLEKLLPVDEFLPIMFNRHPCEEWKSYYPLRNLNALSVEPLLIQPLHYVGDEMYVSDTEDSNHLNHDHHPKHTDL